MVYRCVYTTGVLAKAEMEAAAVDIGMYCVGSACNNYSRHVTWNAIGVLEEYLEIACA